MKWWVRRMDLQKLYNTQKKLDDRIVKEKGMEGQDLLDKKILALQVELGELANEWRGFKFWSKDQKPRMKIVCMACNGVGEVHEPIGGYYFECPHCDGSGLEEDKNPLLEEYVDCLHFILSIGLDAFPELKDYQFYESAQMNDITDQFLHLFLEISGVINYSKYIMIVNLFIGLGEMFGFTWDQIEQAYFEKNQINHDRQSTGY